MKGLKSKRSIDPTNKANELFNPTVAGDDLIEAIRKKIRKKDPIFPDCLNLCNISIIFKQK